MTCVRDDTRCTAEHHDIDASALRAALSLIERAIAGGHGDDGLSYLAAALRRRD